MNKPKKAEEARAPYATSVINLSKPIILERDGQPVAVLMSIEEYERYQALLKQQRSISALDVRRAADRAVFGDLVGCALSSGDPVWVPSNTKGSKGASASPEAAPSPQPHWRVPYRSFDGTLLTEVMVDARTCEVSLTDEERTSLLRQVEHLVAAGDVSA